MDHGRGTECLYVFNLAVGLNSALWGLYPLPQEPFRICNGVAFRSSCLLFLWGCCCSFLLLGTLRPPHEDLAKEIDSDGATCGSWAVRRLPL